MALVFSPLISICSQIPSLRSRTSFQPPPEQIPHFPFFIPPTTNRPMDFYQANAAAAYAQRRITAPVPFWDRKLKHFSPFGLFSKQACQNGKLAIQNYTVHNLFRPKGILSVSLVYGGTGWLFGAGFKNRYHQQYEYH